MNKFVKAHKKKLVMFGVPILALALVTAAIFIAYVKVDATVNEALSTSTIDIDLSGFPGETITEDITVANAASVPLYAKLTWQEMKNHYLLDNLAGTCPGTTCEKKVIISASEAGLTTLDSLDTFSWDAFNVEGYAPHVDVFLDNGEVLVFEYAKVDPAQCDDSADYPTGDFNTFKDKGIVDDSAKAWLSSGPAGPCGDVVFEEGYKTLSDWKTFYPTANIVKIEVEIDNWISPSSTEISSILVNGETTSATGVLYNVEMGTQPVTLPAEVTSTLPVSFTYDSASPVGIVSGRITVERV